MEKMKNEFKTKVYYSDTDAYGVVWHGSYLRWLEMGRCNFSSQYGLDLKKLQENDIVLPVVEINVRYKYSARLDDELSIETTINDISATAIIFKQVIKTVPEGRTCIEAKVKVVTINNNGILYKRLPQVLVQAFSPKEEAHV